MHALGIMNKREITTASADSSGRAAGILFEYAISFAVTALPSVILMFAKQYSPDAGDPCLAMSHYRFANGSKAKLQREQFADGAHEQWEIDGFGQMLVESGRAAFLHIVFHPVAADSHRWHISNLAQ